MEFWESGAVLTILVVLTLLVSASILRRFVPFLKKSGVPTSIMAGVLGLILGPGVLGWIPMDEATLRSIVYHGLALVFISVALQRPSSGQKNAGVVSFSIGIPFLIGLQMLVGLALVVLLMPKVHPGFGLMLPLGFEQGPGQALSLGAAWEDIGMENGASVGLIFAAIGFAWSIVIGIPLAAWGRRRGLCVAPSNIEDQPVGSAVEAPKAMADGGLDRLTIQIAMVGVVYLVTYFVSQGLYSSFAAKPAIAAMAWGFHFVFGAILAIGLRNILVRIQQGHVLDNALLGRCSAVVVDVLTCAALSAVEISVLQSNLVPIVVITTVGGVITLLVVLWLSPRAFPEAPFEHSLVLFGSATGTMPMGLALLRIVDPQLRTSAAKSAVVGSSAAIIGGAPIMMGMLPIPINGWPDQHPGASVLAIGLLSAYLLFLLILWWKLGSLRVRWKPTSLWPSTPPS